MTALTINQLHKSYGQSKVLRGVSFVVQAGEIFAVLGLNGAGKTTLLEIIEGLRKFEKGEIRIMGKPQEEGLNHIGVQLQSSTLPAHIKVSEALKLYAVWSKRDNSQMPFGLSEVKNKFYKDLSTGWKRRLHLALALVTDPKIVFMDEPTAGLDIEARAGLHDAIKAMQAAGKTIILASHDMAEVESLCDRLIMLNDGNVVFCGTANEFTEVNKGKFKIHIKLQGEENYTKYEIADLNGALLELLAVQKNSGKDIVDLKIIRPTLEDSFLSVAKVG